LGLEEPEPDGGLLPGFEFGVVVLGFVVFGFGVGLVLGEFGVVFGVVPFGFVSFGFVLLGLVVFGVPLGLVVPFGFVVFGVVFGVVPGV
jgi:hypothetical protein